ncbi:MAG: site-2 protease family protein [Patescibacteria group bacterium]
MIIITVVIVIFSIILHEVAHGVVANWLGDPTAKYAGRLTLNPLPHIDPIGSLLLPGLAVITQSPFLLGWAKPVPINPYNIRAPWGLPAQAGEALVAFAGPGTNILIAIIAALLLRIPALQTPEVMGIVVMVVIANLSLAILNLIPIPPLDGSKIVAAVLPYQLERQYRQLEAWTYALGPFGLLIVLIVIVNLLSGPMSALISYFFRLLTGYAI